MTERLDDNVYYLRCMRIFNDVKLLEGPLGLSSTLKRHSKLVNWLKTYQKNCISDIEEQLDLFNV